LSPNWDQLVDDPCTSRPDEREAPKGREPSSRRDFDIKATSATFPVAPDVPFGPDADYYEKPEIRRWADVYVFAYYAEKDRTRYSSLYTDGWRFYILSTKEIGHHFGAQDRVALSRVRAVARGVGYADLRASVDAAIDRQVTSEES
jgi:hypothetical protein